MKLLDKYISVLLLAILVFLLSYALVHAVPPLKGDFPVLLSGASRVQGVNSLCDRPKNSPPLSMSSMSNYNVLVILVDFPDQLGDPLSLPYLDNLVLGDSGSVRSFYKEASFGKLNFTTLDSPSVVGWVTADSSYKYYANGGHGLYGVPNARDLAKEIALKIDSFIDFSQYAVYDTNGVGWVDMVLVHSGPGGEVTGNVDDIWSHSWAFSRITLDGVQVGDYVIQPEWFNASKTIRVTRGVFIHEIAHAFGLPDLYDIDGGSYGAGNYTVMASGTWLGTPPGSAPVGFDPHSLYQLGFIQPIMLTSDTVITMLDMSVSGVVYRFDKEFPDDEYFLIARRLSLSDTSLPTHGITIYHIDEDKPTNREEFVPGDDPRFHFRVAVVQADGEYHLERNINPGDLEDKFGSASSIFSSGSNPNNTWYFGGSDFELIKIQDSTFELRFVDCEDIVQVAFSAVPLTGESPLIVQFTNESVGNVSLYLWDFGDGFISYEQNPTHEYIAGGVYTVTLGVANECSSGSLQKDDYIVVECDFVVMNFGAVPTSGDAPLRVEFYDSSLHSTEWIWWFGDGNKSFERNPIHVYNSSGQYTVEHHAKNRCSIQRHGFINMITVLESCCVVPGDADNSGVITIGDGYFLVRYVFQDGIAPECLEAGDANGSGDINVGDAVYLVKYIFENGEAPKCPI